MIQDEEAPDPCQTCLPVLWVRPTDFGGTRCSVTCFNYIYFTFFIFFVVSFCIMRFLACFKDRNFINKAFAVKKINILFSIDKSQIPKCHCKTDVLTACANGPILLFIDDPPYFRRKTALANMQTSILLCDFLYQGIFPVAHRTKIKSIHHHTY